MKLSGAAGLHDPIGHDALSGSEGLRVDHSVAGDFSKLPGHTELLNVLLREAARMIDRGGNIAGSAQAIMRLAQQLHAAREQRAIRLLKGETKP